MSSVSFNAIYYNMELKKNKFCKVVFFFFFFKAFDSYLCEIVIQGQGLHGVIKCTSAPLKSTSFYAAKHTGSFQTS